MSLPSVDIPFTEWLPDLGKLNNPGLTVADNVIPTATGYRPFAAPETGGGALTDRTIAAHWTRHNASYVFAADGNKLYRRETDRTWANVSFNDTDYRDTARWEFASFGPHVIAVAAFVPPQRFNLGATDLPAERFGALPNAPGWATTVAVVRDFVVLGNLDPTDPLGGGGENYVRWSGFNNAEWWEPSLAAQAGFAPLAGDGGIIQKIIGGSSGFIFMQNSVWRMSYIGPPFVWQFDEFAIGRGTSAPQSVVRLDNFIYYYDAAGFYRLDVRNNGFEALGQNKVDAFVRTEAPDECLKAMQATVDPNNKLILWSFCTDPSLTHNNRILAYQYELGRWSLLIVDSDHIAILPTTPLSLDDLDAVLGADIDAFSISVDSQQYTGGEFILSVFDTAHRLGTFTGPPLEARLTTAEYAERSDRPASVRYQRPLVDVTQSTELACRITYRDNLLSTPADTAWAVQTSDLTEARAKAKAMQFQLRIRGGFNHATGLKVFRRSA